MKPPVAEVKPPVAEVKPPVAEAKPPVAEVKPPVAAAESPKAKAHIRSTPEGAQVARATDGEPLGTTPFDLDLPESDKPVALLFWKKGYAAREESLLPRGEVELDVALVASAGSASKSKHKGGGSKGVANTTTIDPFN
jgi:hypothetical protein